MRGIPSSTPPGVAPSPALQPLTPEYVKDEHGVYFDILEDALVNKAETVRNIALTGSYGVGKSSILQEVAKRHHKDVISISLSTLGLADEAAPIAAQSQPSANGGSAPPAASAPQTVSVASQATNRIQKEIVKQLLYSQDPVKMPGSRYRRITRFRFWREVGFACLLSVPLSLVFYLTGWTASLSKLLPAPNPIGNWLHLGVAIALVLLVLSFRRAFHNRIRIDKITAGSATISLSTQASTFFDEYLDEIVYFFEETRRNIVIFEDIDRFDNPHIFETLRALNTILNGAEQLRGRNIRFIYAIKDSIFDELGTRAAREELHSGGGDPSTKQRDDAAEAEIARANRTKFFALVIPVVPFITHRSARDLLSKTLASVNHEVSSELIDLASRHVADMRLIKNIRNEFAIFKRRIIDDGSLNLSQDALLAMILYKNVHLSDFELIRVGASVLDKLYRDSRELVAVNIAERNARIRRARNEIQNLVPGADRSQWLGDALASYLDRTERHANVARSNRTFNGQTVTDELLHSAEFWNQFAAGDSKIEISFTNRNGYPHVLTYTRDDIAEALGEQIDTDAWRKSRAAELRRDIAKAVAERDFLGHADMGALYARPEFKLSQNEVSLSFASLAEQRLRSELAVDLLRAGYIDRNFTLYTSTYYGERVSANATNFMIKHVETNQPDSYFALDAEDVAAILRERTTSFLTDKSALNIHILDYVLTQDAIGARKLIAQLMAYGSDQQDFLFAYLESGSHTTELVQELAQRWEGIFQLLIVDARLGDDVRAALVDTALKALADDVDYEVDRAVGDFLSANYQELTAFTADETAAPASVLAGLLDKADVRLDRLAPLAPLIREAVVALGAYQVTRDNLLCALGGESSLALDAIGQQSSEVLQRVLDDLPAYLGALEEGEVTVDEPANFVDVINDVLGADVSQVRRVVIRASSACVIETLKDAPTHTWPMLAEYGRFRATAANVLAYVGEHDVDTALAGYLTNVRQIEASSSVDEAARATVARAILQADGQLSDPELRVRLVQSLELEEQIPASELPSEPGKLVGYLLEVGLLADDAEAFAALDPEDWSGREFAIAQSSNFASFMTPTEVPVKDLAKVMRSTTVPVTVKDALVERFAEFTAGASCQVLELLATHSVQSGRGLGLGDINRLAQERVRASTVIALLAPHLPNVSVTELRPILDALGGDYPKLTERNGKRPRIPHTEASRALADRLVELELASSVDPVGGVLRVNMRRR